MAMRSRATVHSDSASADPGLLPTRSVATCCGPDRDPLGRAREGHERHRRALRRLAHREVEALEAPALADPLVEDPLELVVR